MELTEWAKTATAEELRAKVEEMAGALRGLKRLDSGCWCDISFLVDPTPGVHSDACYAAQHALLSPKGGGESDDVCMCGDPMTQHTGYEGHSAVSMRDYYEGGDRRG